MTYVEWPYTVNTKFFKGNTERTAFWNWFTDTLGGCAGNFHCAALKRTPTSTEYFRFKAIPDESEGQKNRVLSLEIEEVY